LKVGGQPLIEHHLRGLARAGIDSVVINLAWRGAEIMDYLGQGEKYGLEISYSTENAGALETGGGIHNALPLLGDPPFWVVNGDVYCEFEFPRRPLEPGILGHLVMVPNPDHHPQGDFCLAGDRVIRSGKRRLTYAGIALLQPALFADAKAGKFPLAPLLVEAMERNLITGELFSGRWVDVGTPERLQELERQLSGR
jgi:MurNAc alpha-1-phosphate uridylyltransferase